MEDRDKRKAYEVATEPLGSTRPERSARHSIDGDTTGVYSVDSDAKRPTLSESLWGDDCFAHLPVAIEGPSKVTAIRGDWDRAVEFLNDFPQLREESNRQPSSSTVNYAKRRYLRIYCDLIEVRKDGETIGVFIGAPEDWSTYYCRVLAFNPRRSGRSVIRRLFNACLVDPLTALGVERLVGDTAPTNPMMSRWFLELGFQVTGQKLTERWGPFVQYTKFLGSPHQQAFARRFGQNVPPGANDNSIPPGAIEDHS